MKVAIYYLPEEAREANILAAFAKSLCKPGCEIITQEEHRQDITQ